MGPQPAFRAVLQTTVKRALMVEPCESASLCAIVDIPKKVMRDELADVTEAFLESLGTAVAVDRHNWCSIWLLLNSWIDPDGRLVVGSNRSSASNAE